MVKTLQATLVFCHQGSYFYQATSKYAFCSHRGKTRESERLYQRSIHGARFDTCSRAQLLVQGMLSVTQSIHCLLHKNAVGRISGSCFRRWEAKEVCIKALHLRTEASEPESTRIYFIGWCQSQLDESKEISLSICSRLLY